MFIIIRNPNLRKLYMIPLCQVNLITIIQKDKYCDVIISTNKKYIEVTNILETSKSVKDKIKEQKEISGEIYIENFDD